MRKNKFIKIAITLPFAINPILATTFCVTSCAQSNFDISGSNWKGVVRGSFDKYSYTIDHETQTVTYNNGLGIQTENLVIPNYVYVNGKNYKVQIGPKCFAGNEKITGSVEFNDFTYIIPYLAFYDCISLKTVIFHEPPTVIDDYAFCGCILLEDVRMKNPDENWLSQAAYIGNYAFAYCWMPKNLVFADDLYYIGKCAFIECYGIEDVYASVCSFLTNISESTFAACDFLKTISLPSTIVSFEPLAFNNCRRLQRIYMYGNNNTITFGDFAFNNCVSFIGFDTQLKIQDVGEGCFSTCRALESQIFGFDGGAKIIEKAGFEDCNFATLVFHPKSPIDVGNFAFSYCTKLSTVDFLQYGTLPPPSWSGTDIFLNIMESGAIYLSKNASIDQWEDFLVKHCGFIIDDNHWHIQRL